MVADTMKALADKLSDYYRRRIEDLSQLAQGLLDALIRGLHPRDSRETLYRVTDQVLLHLYRPRQGHQQALTTPLATILELLRAFYTRDEHRAQAMPHLADGRAAEARLFADLAREGGPDATTGASMARFGSGLHFDRAHPHRGASRACRQPPATSGRASRRTDRPRRRMAPAHSCRSGRPRDHQGRGARPDGTGGRGGAALATADRGEGRYRCAGLAAYEPAVLLWHVCGDQPRALRQVATIAAMSGADLPPGVRALALRDPSFKGIFDDQHEEAIAAARKAVGLAAAVQDRREQAESLRQAAFSLGRLGRHQEVLSEALAGFRRHWQASDS